MEWAECNILLAAVSPHTHSSPLVIKEQAVGGDWGLNPVPSPLLMEQPPTTQLYATRA